MQNFDKLVFLGRELARSQLITKNWGNLSCRKNDDFYITHSGCFCVNIDPSTLVKIDIKKGNFDKKLCPSLEREMHRMIYKLYDSVNFIAHTHQTWAGALSASGLSKLDISLEARTSIVGKTIPIIDYALPNSKKFLSNFTDSLKNQGVSKLAIIAHKGGLFFAENEKEILSLARDLEIEAQKFLVNMVKSKYPNLEVSLTNLGDTLLEVFISKRQSLFQNRDEKASSLLQELEYLLEDMNLDVCVKKDPISRIFSNFVTYPALDDFAQFIGEKIKPLSYKNAVKKINSLQSNGFFKTKNASLVLSLENRGFLVLTKNKSLLYTIENILEKNFLALLVADLFDYNGALRKLDSFLLRKNYIYRYSKQIHSENYP